jgi:hypothetical protein
MGLSAARVVRVSRSGTRKARAIAVEIHLFRNDLLTDEEPGRARTPVS